MNIIPNVLDWLLDLLGETTFAPLDHVLGNAQLRENGNDAVVRTLRNWQYSGSLPKSSDKIKEVFPDDTKLVFNGAFKLNVEESQEKQFDNAWEFIFQHKGLSIEQLSRQIPMTQERLRPIHEKKASVEEKTEFVRNVKIRYAAPTMATIRQRLRVARLTQAGYQDLLKIFCPNLKPEDLTQKNKALQLVALFTIIYNKKIQAWNHGRTKEEQDAWFVTQFAPSDRYDFLLPLMSSITWDDRIDLLVDLLTRRFFSIKPEQELESILPFGDEDPHVVLRPRVERMQKERDEDERVVKLRQRVKAASPYRALQAESSFWVLTQFAQSDGLNEKIRQMAWQRMAEVASSPLERGNCQILELEYLLHGDRASRHKNIRSMVKEKLDAAEADLDAWRYWKAPMLRLKAKHALFENRMDDAESFFKDALEACSERAFGSLRGEIAKECFAVVLARNTLNPQNHEPYYRNMLHFTEFTEKPPSFEDAATKVEEFFWKQLYQPYPGLESFAGGTGEALLNAFKDTFEMIAQADWERFKDWLEENAKSFREDDFKDVRRNSFLMQLLKSLYRLEDEASKVEQLLRNVRASICMLLNAWPEQARLSDFKGQTPLMMAAHHGDHQLVELLLPLSEINAQDYLGRTVLHVAVAGRSLDCFKAVLALNPDVLKVSCEDKNTVAHTAVRFGWGEGLRLLLEQFPELAGEKNHFGQTPIEMAQDLFENYESWHAFMREQQARTIGTRSDFECVLALLKEHESGQEAR